MNSEKAHYIIKYYFNLLPVNEKIAWKHYNSMSKLKNSENSEMYTLYIKKGWISDNETVLSLLKDGYEKFEINAAKKILLENPNEVFINNCAICGKLARTPFAKQCRHCDHNWH